LIERDEDYPQSKNLLILFFGCGAGLEIGIAFLAALPTGPLDLSAL